VIAVTGLVVPDENKGMLTVALVLLTTDMLLRPLRASCIVKLVWPGAVARVAGLQESPEFWVGAAGTLITELVVFTVIPAPAALTAAAFDRVASVVVAPDAMVRVM
jgi:hypothetical protein